MGLRFSVTARNVAVVLGFALAIASSAFGAENEIPLDRDAAAGKHAGWATTTDGRLQVLVELTQPAAVAAYTQAIAGKSLRDPQVRKFAADATASSIRSIQAQQKSVQSALASLGTREIYRTTRVLNGIAVAVAPEQLAALRRIPGVRRVLPIPQETLSLTTSVPFLGVPNLWDNSIGLPNSLTGSGVRIGIIDTGVDYIHADFGGTGALTDYQADAITPAFPTAKVVGGVDFAGDAYTGSNAPSPGASPMDCNGHGTHVAGIAAGFGVNTDGTTYTGGYSNATPFASLQVGPGVAPDALLYAIRVFGCGGSTGLVVQGVDWAIDPNGDNDFSDHLDVINLSLGSSFGNIDNADTAAVESAAAAGVIVVSSAGNAGDTYFISGSPAVANSTISTAASADSGVAAVGITINSPGSIAGAYASAGSTTFGPTTFSPLTGPVIQAIDPADGSGPSTTDGCSALTNAASIAGNIALIDRGTCPFTVKVKNAQNAGAIAAIIVNNDSSNPLPIGLGGTDSSITIPAASLSTADGATIKAQLGAGVNATLANTNAGDTLASFSSRGPRGGAVPTRLKPDITAPGVNIVSAQSGHTCVSGGCLVTSPTGYIAGSQALTLSGTSMASPHMAGVMALLRQLHSDWSVEQLKALAMNGALHDLTSGANGGGLTFGLGRVGAGRVDPADSAVSAVVALNGEDSGLVSVSFDTAEVVGTATEIKKVRLVNTGTTAKTYNLAIDVVTAAPGVSLSLPGGSSVTIPAGASTEIDVGLSANAAQMTHAHDPTIALTQAAPAPLTSLGNLARHWLTEESGYLVLSQGGVPKLRVPLYAAIRPAATMNGPSAIVTGGAPTGSTTLPLSGSDVCTGTLGAGPTCTGTFPNDEESLVTPTELQVEHARDTSIPDYANIQYAGVSYSPATSQLIFAVSTWGDWATPTDVAVNIYIDNNNDGTYDRVLYNTNPGSAAAGLFGTAGVYAQDSFHTEVFNIATSGVSTGTYLNRVAASSVDSVVFKTNVMFLAATPASLGLSGTSFKYKIQTCSGTVPICSISGSTYDLAAGPYVYDYLNQGLNFSGANLADDLNGAALPVTWNTANIATNGSLGALLLHHHNRHGQRAQVIPLDTSSSTDLAIAQSVSPASPQFGDNATFTLTVSNNGASNATGVQVTDILPSGLTYVSDDGGGAYDAGTGFWSIGALANGASATLHLVATVASTDKTCNVAQITASTPLDTNPANDQVSTCVMATQSSDLVLSMSVSSPTVIAGNSVVYTLDVKNNGVDTAYSLNIQNAFPAFPGLHASSAAPSQGVYTASTGVWNIGSLANGATASLAITVTTPSMAGNLVNNGTASTSNNDPDSANNAASAVTQVLSPATLTATNTVAGAFAQNGVITYTIVIANSSATAQQDNPGHEFTDVLPSTLTLISATATGGTAVANLGTNTVTWDGTVPATGSVTLTITATIKSTAAGSTISNQGTVLFDADGNGTNESSTTTDDPTVAGANNPTAFVVTDAAIVVLPADTLDRLGMALFALAMIWLSTRRFRAARNR